MKAIFLYPSIHLHRIYFNCHLACAITWQTSRKCSVRVRFAPSPTGQLHLGGLRTALYNFLFARSRGGKFLLRIEDTDQTRKVEGAVEKLQEMLAWSGIDVDEGPGKQGDCGPYVQSERLSYYSKYADILLKEDLAYPCFCSVQRLELIRREALKRRESPRYDNKCQTLSSEERAQLLAENRPHTIRFKLSSFREEIHDVVCKNFYRHNLHREGDLVIIKSDGYPTYHFANVIDDHLMNVTHVLRGMEWLSSVAKHILIFRAFNWVPPQYGHLPIMLNQDGSKLSKRQNDLHVEQLKKAGYLPETLLNFVTISGGGFQEDTLGMDMKQMIQSFDLFLVISKPAQIDFSRMPDINRLHLNRMMSSEREISLLVEKAQQLLLDSHQERIKTDDALKELIFDKAFMKNILLWGKDRLSLLSDLNSYHFAFLWNLPSKTTILTLRNQVDDAEEVLKAVLTCFTETQLAFPSEYSSTFRDLAITLQIKFPLLMKILRLIITNSKEGPPVGEMCALVGSKIIKERLKYAIQMLQKNK